MDWCAFIQRAGPVLQPVLLGGVVAHTRACDPMAETPCPLRGPQEVQDDDDITSSDEAPDLDDEGEAPDQHNAGFLTKSC